MLTTSCQDHRYSTEILICTNIHPLGTEYYEVHTFELQPEVQSLMSLIKAVAKEAHAKFRL